MAVYVDDILIFKLIRCTKDYENYTIHPCVTPSSNANQVSVLKIGGLKHTASSGNYADIAMYGQLATV